MIEDRFVALPDGRRLTYAAWGAPEGRPVLWMHGWPGCRLAGALLEDAARDADVRVVVPDRPGIGGSDARPERRLLDWADDLAQLCDALGHDTFGLVGYSGGGPFALAAAHRLRDRLARRADGGPALAVVSSQVPLSDPADRARMPAAVQAVFALHQHVPFATNLTVGLMALGMQHLPELFTVQAKATLPVCDQQLLERPALKNGLQREYQEAFRLGISGVVHEVRLFAEDWGFDLGGLPRGLWFFHGEADRNVPVSLARRLAARLPEPRTRFEPDAGHLWALHRADRVFAALA